MSYSDVRIDVGAYTRWITPKVEPFNSQSTFPELPANRTYRGHVRIDAIDRVFTHGVIPGIEPYSGPGNQLSRNRRGPPMGLAIMENGNGALCRTGRIAEADSDLHC